MADGDLEYRIGKLALAPGDILVVKAAKDMPAKDWKAFREAFKRHIPNNVLLMVSGDVDLSVLTLADIEARAP